MEFCLDSLQPKERASFALRALYEAAGCRKYHMGRFEEYGLYQENRSFLSSEQVITFTDLDGRLLALKPDVTLSIAKTAQPSPGETLRYYYHENVYRPSAESHTFQEISQMGLEMLDAVAARVNVPIIASGGAGKKEDFLELFHHKGIDAGLAAGIFHQKLLTIHDLKTYLNENGVEMRL